MIKMSSKVNLDVYVWYTLLEILLSGSGGWWLIVIFLFPQIIVSVDNVLIMELSPYVHFGDG